MAYRFTCLALEDGSALATRESFSRRSFRVCCKEGLLRLTRDSTIIGRLFFQLETPRLGVDADCGGVP